MALFLPPTCEFFLESIFVSFPDWQEEEPEQGCVWYKTWPHSHDEARLGPAADTQDEGTEEE